MPTKIAHLSSAHPRYDTRIFIKMCTSLAKHRYDVSIIVADEMLEGYIGYPGQRLRSLIETRNYRDAWHFIREWSKFPWRNKILAAEYTLSEFSEGKIYTFLRNIYGKPLVPSWISQDFLRAHGVKLNKPRIRSRNHSIGRRVIDELSLSLSTRGLSSLLRHVDRNSMRFSVENRVPFFNARYGQFSFVYA
jgi:asparagine synthase (glutamine-hydrolysing)